MKIPDKKLPKKTLQDEELTVILKALESYVATDIDEEVLAHDLAMDLRNRAGWKGYYPKKSIDDYPSDLPQDRMKQFKGRDNPAECKSGVCD